MCRENHGREKNHATNCIASRLNLFQKENETNTPKILWPNHPLVYKPKQSFIHHIVVITCTHTKTSFDFYSYTAISSDCLSTFTHSTTMKMATQNHNKNSAATTGTTMTPTTTKEMQPSSGMGPFRPPKTLKSIGGNEKESGKDRDDDTTQRHSGTPGVVDDVVVPSSPSLQLTIERVHKPRFGSSFTIETIVRRSGNIYTMYLQTTKKAHPLYVGEKQQGGESGGSNNNNNAASFVFRSVLNGGEDLSTTLMGSICKVTTPSSSSVAALSSIHRHHVRSSSKESEAATMKRINPHNAVTYALMYHPGKATQQQQQAPGSSSSSSSSSSSLPLLPSSTGGVVVGHITYEIPTVFQALTEKGGTPRRALVHILGRTYVETKEPTTGRQEGHLSLDFQGRGREASCKNIQLVDTTNSAGATGATGGGGKIVLQMAKWDKDQFHLDFSYPFDAFHAFGFAMAQFDL